MRLTWRDGITTVLAALVVLVTLAATQGWDWPLLGSERAAVAALTVLGYAMCVFGGSRTALAITLAVLWALTTLRHALIGPVGPRATLRAG